jgi:hypothetical protein
MKYYQCQNLSYEKIKYNMIYYIFKVMKKQVYIFDLLHIYTNYDLLHSYTNFDHSSHSN